MLVAGGPLVVAAVHGLVLLMVIAWIVVDARRTQRRAPSQRIIKLPEPRTNSDAVIDLRDAPVSAEPVHQK